VATASTTVHRIRFGAEFGSDGKQHLSRHSLDYGRGAAESRCCCCCCCCRDDACSLLTPYTSVTWSRISFCRPSEVVGDDVHCVSFCRHFKDDLFRAAARSWRSYARNKEKLSPLARFREFEQTALRESRLNFYRASPFTNIAGCTRAFGHVVRTHRRRRKDCDETAVADRLPMNGSTPGSLLVALCGLQDARARAAARRPASIARPWQSQQPL
jgi:hypothetical protein